MPSGITKTDQLMYTEKMPWHKNGVKLDNPATAAEAISAASMDWNVIQTPVYFQSFGQQRQQVPNKLAVVREDTNAVFGIMGENYVPIQNTQAFEFFDAVVSQGEAVYHTAGSLHGGKRIWILAKLPEDIKIIPEDTIQPYILLSNSHDGTTALRMQVTPIRVVCWNTLSAAMRRTGGFYARHTRNIMTKANDAREMLGLVQAHYEIFASQVDQLVNTRMDKVAQGAFFRELYEFDPNKAPEEQDYRKQNAYDATLEALEHPTNTLGGIQGTAWAAFNAVTYYIDHTRAVRSSLDTADERRLEASWFGTGAAIRQKAFDTLTTVNNL